MNLRQEQEPPVNPEVPEVPLPINRRLVEMKKWLAERGLTQAKIARAAKVSGTSVYHVLRGLSRSRKIEDILRAYGCPEDLLQIKVA